MRVTEKAGRGFVVETPDGEITDLGTEFGVDVMAGRESALAVFEGAVDLLVADQGKEIPHIERLLGGDGAMFSKGGRMDRLNSITTGGAHVALCGEKSSISFDTPLIVEGPIAFPRDQPSAIMRSSLAEWQKMPCLMSTVSNTTGTA